MPSTHRRRDETVLSRRQCEHNLQLAHNDCRRIRSTIWKLTKRLYSGLTTWVLIDIDNFFNNDDMTMSLLKKLSISIKIHVVKQLCSVFKLSIKSVGSRCELVANCVHTADASQQFRRVGGVYWALCFVVPTPASRSWFSVFYFTCRL